MLVNFGSSREKARIVRARVDMKQIHNAITLLHMDTGEWPGHKTPDEVEPGSADNEICSDGCSYELSDCMAGLVCNPSPPDEYAGWQGPYIPSIPEDPWGNEYFFDTDYDINPEAGETWAAVIGSYGSNGEGLNQYDEDDVIRVLKSE